MVGVIRGWDILAHPIATIRCFGWRVFFQAVAPWQTRTFLSIVTSGGFPNATAPGIAAICPVALAHETRSAHRLRECGGVA